MAENDETTKQSGFQNHLYRAELGATRIGDPTIKIIPNAQGHVSASERHVAACVYEVAAALERATQEIGGRWAISPFASDGRLVTELTKTDSPRRARELIEQVDRLQSEANSLVGTITFAKAPTRTDLPVVPNVGGSKLTSSMSGSRVGLPTGMANTGTPFNRSLAAASTGGGPSFQSPSEMSTIARRVGYLSSACASGEFRSVPCPSRAWEKG